MTRIFTDVITNMNLPDDVATALRQAWINSGDRPVLEADKLAIRAALQAMVDNGMARVSSEGSIWDNDIYSVIIIRLGNADERKRKDKP